MLSPKRVKFRKMFKGRTRGHAKRGSEISFGTYGLQSLDRGWFWQGCSNFLSVPFTSHPEFIPLR